jgi:hypothetical protein
MEENDTKKEKDCGQGKAEEDGGDGSGDVDLTMGIVIEAETYVVLDAGSEKSCSHE